VLASTAAIPSSVAAADDDELLADDAVNDDSAAADNVNDDLVADDDLMHALQPAEGAPEAVLPQSADAWPTMDASRALQAHNAAAALPIYDQMIAHLRQTNPPIVGIRFELLLDGVPEHLGLKCETQLHVVVVRQVSWQNLKYFSCLRLAFMLALMGYLLCHLFGPITGLVALYLLNNEHLVREFALGLPHGGNIDQMSQNVAAGVATVACIGLVLHTAVSSIFGGLDGYVFLLVVWLIEKLYGLTLVTLAFSCVCKRDVYERLNPSFRGTDTFDVYFINQFNRARSIMVMLAFQHVICLIFHLNFSEDATLVSFFKLVVMGCLTVVVIQLPSKFYFFCSESFSIPGLPQFQPPPLFIFNTADITRVLEIRHALRTRSNLIIDITELGIAHVQPDHIDSVCVGHVTTERWLSSCVHPAVYNSPAWRRVLYQTYTYLLPVVNFLFLVLFPSVTVAKLFSHARRSFSNDLMLAVLSLVRFFFEKVLSAVVWALASFFIDLNDLVLTITEFFGNIFHWIADGFVSVSAYISAFDQWISYVASRFESLKKVFALMFQSVQALCVILYKVVGAFTKILPYINNARAVSSTAASVDVVGRLSQSGWIRNLWLRWFARRQHAHSE
jgi:hypothetical protein